MKTQVKMLVALAASAIFASTAYADVAGASSNENYIRAGGTQGGTVGHPGASGLPGVGVHASKTPFKAVSLSGLKFYSNLAGQTTNNVAYVRQNMMPPTHRDFGSYAFSDTTNSNLNLGLFGDVVYFGEWSQNGDMTDNTHTVYYVGRNKTTSMPNSGKFKYNVKGINSVGNDGLMNSSNFTVDFGNNSVSGDIKKSTSGLFNVRVDATIDPSTASFLGTAKATGSQVVGTANGISKGEFFGNGAAALGGMATFTTKKYDTAFAGTKGSQVTN